ncbi:MAG: Cytochrome bd-I ubiquinol oxidase subunit 2 [Chlamydiales bacterium]|nr:Cytochrome bd-I ubiquinol oxidase subunit 2 [Chlamydiales bacterium]MCH9619131.1 Cytochrome bd-I ubiquinol oxidase subunit 2 [Chlamydiales bacterium]MCH9622393.1 Cytochrome bd-I ubiquinol oxidase subunit 2 [Chlamydiales bacterium]
MISGVEYGFMIFWFIIIMVCMAQYAMLDGFDLGVGILMPSNKTDMERRICYNAIGPVWDGNEVWLVVVVGALFAGFPLVYATMMSAFYTPIMILIFSLIFRAVAIEFRSKRPYKWWRNMWDTFFCLASLLIAFAVGVALGNFVAGIPLNEYHQYTGGIIMTFLRPYPILVGVFGLSIFILHATIFLVMKTEGTLQERYKKYALPVTFAFLALYILTTVLTITLHEHMIARFERSPWFFIIPALNLLVIIGIPFAVYKNRFGTAFVFSCLNVLFLITLFACGVFPDLIRSSTNPEYSLTIFNTSSSLATLKVLMVITAIGIPLVIAYMVWVYTIFHGKVVIDDHSY